ncbi:MAG: hypothetical protein RR903_00775 [Edwardsiella sp. (in: enterobacteria)]
MSDFTPKELKEELAERHRHALEYLAFRPVTRDRPDGASEETRNEQKKIIEFLASKLGPFIDSYPEWHPLNAYGYKVGGEHSIAYRYSDTPHTQNRPKFSWLDHTLHMVNGFITCPYGHGVEELMQELEVAAKYWCAYKLPEVPADNMPLYGWMSLAFSFCEFHAAPLTYELLVDEFGYDGDPEAILQLYAPNAHPILIWVEWRSDDFDLSENDFRPIPQHYALPLMMARTLADMVHASCAEDWESMQYLLVGSPHSDHLSPFIERSTMTQLRKTFEQLMQCIDQSN